MPEPASQAGVIMDPEKDSLRFYYLGNQYEKKVEHFGCKNTYLPEDTLIL